MAPGDDFALVAEELGSQDFVTVARQSVLKQTQGKHKTNFGIILTKKTKNKSFAKL